jgi:hypothetical protein
MPARLPNMADDPMLTVPDSLPMAIQHTNGPHGIRLPSRAVRLVVTYDRARRAGLDAALLAESP